MSTLYIYSGPMADAARHLVKHSALAHITEVTEPYWYAGADSTRVALDIPFPSDGEWCLWGAVEALANQDAMVDVVGAIRTLDADNLRTFHEALAIALGQAELVQS